jgi:hypothetical protein
LGLVGRALRTNIGTSRATRFRVSLKETRIAHFEWPSGLVTLSGIEFGVSGSLRSLQVKLACHSLYCLV